MSRLLEKTAPGYYLIKGELNFESVNELLEQLSTEVFREPPEQLTIDLKALTHSNSAGLALLLECLRKAKQSKISLRYVNMPGQLRDMAIITGVDEILPIALKPGNHQRKKR